MSNNLNKKMGNNPNSPCVLNKFKPGKREHVLDDSVLDDATRRMLMEEITGRKPPSLPLPNPSAGTSTAHANGPKVPALSNSKAPPASGGAPQRPTSGGAHPSSSSSSAYQSNTLGGTDDLLTIMTQRLKTLENNQRVMQLEMKEKSRKIIELEDNLKAEKETRQKAVAEKSSLQRELGELLQFLDHHGLTWDGSLDASMKPHEDDDDDDDAPKHTTKKKYGTAATDTDDVDSHVPVRQKAPALSLLYDGDFSMPSTLNGVNGDDALAPQPPAVGSGASAPRPPLPSSVPFSAPLREELAQKKQSDDEALPFDLALLKRNCLILSDHVGNQAFLGEGQKKIFKEREKVFLCVYSDGICVNSGPFRPYGWALCDAFLNDILEGYYPYEFKDRYPDGFPVELIDRSTVKCPVAVNSGAKGNGSSAASTAASSAADGGRRLGGTASNPNNGGARTPSSSSTPPPPPQPAAKRSDQITTLKEHAEQEGTFKPMTRDEFLKKLPERYIAAGGRLVNVRAGVEELVGKGAKGGGDGTAKAGEGQALGTGPSATVGQARSGSQVRSNVDKLLQQAAENKKADAEIKLARQSSEAAVGQSLASAATPAPVNLIISAKGEVVGTGGTAPANAAFLQTIKGNTPASVELARRQQATEAKTPPSNDPKAEVGADRSRIVTLQIRMPMGQRCVLNMFSGDTIGDVRREFERAVPDFFRGRSQQSPLGPTNAINAYEFSSVFPRRICSDHTAVLEALGLYPNATLMVRMTHPDDE